MKKKLLLVAGALTIMAISVCACGKDKEEPTTEVVEEVTVGSDLAELMNEEIPAVSKDEIDAMDAYNAYFEDGKEVDTEALLKDLEENIIPKYETFLSNLDTIEIETDEVKEAFALYCESMDLQYQALQKVEFAIKDSDQDYQGQASKLLSKAVAKYSEFQQKVVELAEANDVVVNGEVMTTEASDDEEVTEATTEAPTEESEEEAESEE